MAAGNLRDTIKSSAVSNSGALAFILALFMWVIDFFVPQLSFTGLIIVKDPVFYSTFFTYFMNTALPIVVGIVAYNLITEGQINREKIMTYSILGILIAFFWLYGGYRTVIHLLFPWLIMWSLPDEATGGSNKIKVLIGLYLLDFLMPSIIAAFLPRDFALVFGNTLVVPVWVLYTAGCGWRLSGGNWMYAIVVLAILLILMFNYLDARSSYNLSKNNLSEARKGFVDVVTKGLKNMGDIFSQATFSFTQMFNQSYYEGTPEKTEKPQGLYLKEITSGDIDYRTDSPVYLWARLEANTIDQEINADVICYTEIEDDFGTRIVRGVVDEDSKSMSASFSVITGVERSIPCIFENLPAGSYDVQFNASFTFSTEARKKIYLMNRQRLLNDLQLLSDRGKEPRMEDVLSQLYDIKDTDPTSIFTTGPIQLAIGTDKVPWDIGEKNNIKPLFGVTVSNMWHQGGKIAQINDLYLKIPDSFSFASLDKSCTFPITETSEQSEDGYKTYKLAPLKGISDIENYVTVNCHMTIDPASSLDPVPVTTRSLKTRVDYTYVMQEDISIEVNDAGIGSDVQNILARERACCQLTKGSDKTYIIVNSEKECTDNTGEGTFSQVVESSLCGA